MQPKALDQHPLAICFNLLAQMGKQGQYVWQRGKDIEDMSERIDYLRTSIAWLRAKAREDHWQTIPVDFRTFVESKELLNKKGILWPSVVACGAEINSGRYVEAVLTGAIGTGKTTLALYCQAFQLYILSCIKNPHQLFDLDPSSEILIVFQSINKNLAQDVDYRRFRDMISQSPYFQVNFMYEEDREKEMRFPRNVVVKPVAGHDTAAIGQNVIGGIIDELNFMAIVENSKQTRDGSTYDQATKNYNSIARRRDSRFMQLGQLPGMLCLVSSRNYPGQFTDKKEEEARSNPRIYIYDKRVWDLRPERYCFYRGVLSDELIELYGENAPFWFHVFSGDETRKPRILHPDEEVDAEDRHLVVAVPLEHRKAFETDLLAALRDIAGLATQALHPFMTNTDAVSACFGKVQSILSQEACDFETSKVQIYPKRLVNPEEPRFAHIDLALSKDSAGISIGHVPRFVDVNRGDYIETLPVVQFDAILEIRPPKGGEIHFEKIRALFYKLREIGLPIKWVSFDSFQSRDSMQIMATHGFITGYQSMDVDTYPYDVTKQAFYDNRILAPEHRKAHHELVTLEIDTKKNKIDHPPHSSKDVSDSMAGVIFGLTQQRSIWVRHRVPLHNRPPSIQKPVATDRKSSVSYKEMLREQRHGGEERRYG